jgi:hypothetical protein
MATSPGERIQREEVKKYTMALDKAWFQNFLVKYRGENSAYLLTGQDYFPL